MPFDLGERTEMKRYGTFCASILLGMAPFAGSAQAAQLFMVAKVVGDVNTRTDSGEDAAFGYARWFPKSTRVFTRGRSGVEALSPGLFLRFGEETVFSFGPDELQMHKGALLARMRDSGKELRVTGPEATLRMKGAGSLLLEIVTNGGFKIIGLTGKPSVSIGPGSEGRDLFPGELLFLKPLDAGLSDPVHVNLVKLLASSFLVRGFPNSTTFDTALVQEAQVQAELITKTFRAEVGDAREASSFEIRIPPAETTAEPAESNATTSVVEEPTLPEPEPIVEPEPVPEPIVEPEPEPEPIVEPEPAPEPVVEPEPVSEPPIEKEPVPPTDSNALPEIPGPPLKFHTREKPPPTLKEVFEQPPPPKPKFPGKIFSP